jgi:hypothetical protein
MAPERTARSALVLLLARSAIAGAVVTAVEVGLGVADLVAWTKPLAEPLTFGSWAFVLALSAVVELAAERRPPGWKRDLGAAVLTVVAGVALGLLGLLQASYLWGIVSEGSFAGALEGVGNSWWRMRTDPSRFARIFLAHALPLGPLAWSRLRGCGLARQVGVTVGACLVLEPLLLAIVWTLVSGEIERWDIRWTAVVVGAEAILAPLLFALADRLAKSRSPEGDHGP